MEKAFLTKFFFQSAPIITNPCEPSPCGPSSQCRAINGQSVCSCLPQYIGSPPSCRPECVSDSDCPQNEACSNQKCMNPCQGACGRNSLCDVINHRPYCKCENGFRGDPFSSCQREPQEDVPPSRPLNPCYPSPCGPNSICREINEQAVCSCVSEMIGSPPNCRPECTSNSECSSNLACMNQKCQNPCVGACASSAECKVVSHTTICICPQGTTGDPLVQCVEKQQDYPIQTYTPCSPNPCGIHAFCREQNGAGACTCEQDYIGDPYQGCRPECILSSDCPSHLACINSKCKDPCPGTCAQNAFCQVVNHVATCSCDVGFTGDGYRYCQVQREERKNSQTINFIHNPLLTLLHSNTITNILIILNFHKILQIHFSFHFHKLSSHSNIPKSMLTITLRT